MATNYTSLKRQYVTHKGKDTAFVLYKIFDVINAIRKRLLTSSGIFRLFDFIVGAG
jgi:hypothetical protein